MFQKQLTFILIALLAGLCLANSVHADLNFQTDLTVGQRPPNTEYKRKVQQDGTYEISPISPSSIRVGTGAYAYGFGRATAKISGTVNGSKTSTTRSYKVGKWGSITSLSFLKNNFTNERKWVSAYIRGPFSHAAKSTPYTWNADAEIKLQGYWYNGSQGWVPIAEPNKKVSEGNTGSWTVTEVKVCPSCKKEVDSFTEHQITCTTETFWHTGSIFVAGGCRATYWKCKDASSHRRIWYRGSPYKRCSLPSHLSEDNSNGGTSGGTTSPTVQNNGGNTGGTSSDRVRCGHSNCQRGGWASSREAHKTTCPAGHSYYACSLNGASFHANCRAQRSGQVRCARGSMCRSGGWASSRNAHQTTCRRGHTYWSCWPRSVSQHRRH